MKHISLNGMCSESAKKLYNARKEIYRRVLRDPGSTPQQKAVAQAKLKVLDLWRYSVYPKS
jgi:hypothetical protein